MLTTIKIFVPRQREFWAGVVMATPFYAEFFPWAWIVWLTVPLLFFIRFPLPSLRLPHAAIVPMVILLLFHGIALSLSETRFEAYVVKDMAVASFLLGIYCVANEEMSDGFFLALLPLGTVTALIGLTKAALLDRGYLLGFILDNCHYYPAGSALCVDYNNLGLLWLVTALGCLKRRYWLLLPILVAAGALSSSRRFLMLMPFLPLVWALIEGKAAAIRMALIAALTILSVYFVSDLVSYERFLLREEPYTVILNFKGETALKEIDPVNRSAPTVMLGTMANDTLGTASRLPYWKLALAHIGCLPKGFEYHEIFSCAFSSCMEFHYPHMAIMSEWLVGGMLLGVIAVLFYVWPAWLVWRQKSIMHISLLMMAAPYSLISGDTVFSQPIYIACMLVALSSVPRKLLSPSPQPFST